MAAGGQRTVRIAPPRYAPQLPEAPPEEAAGREQINRLLHLACLFVYRYARAVSLIEHCAELIGPDHGIEPADWQGIALRDAVHSLFHFGKTHDALSAALKSCPTLRASIDLTPLRVARKAFDRDFRDLTLLRNAVAHVADELSTPARRAKLQRPGEFLIWEGQVGAHLSMASNRGRQVQLVVDAGSLARLEATLEAICLVFAAAPGARWQHVCG